MLSEEHKESNTPTDVIVELQQSSESPTVNLKHARENEINSSIEVDIAQEKLPDTSITLQNDPIDLPTYVPREEFTEQEIKAEALQNDGRDVSPTPSKKLKKSAKRSSSSKKKKIKSTIDSQKSDGILNSTLSSPTPQPLAESKDNMNSSTSNTGTSEATIDLQRLKDEKEKEKEEEIKKQNDALHLLQELEKIKNRRAMAKKGKP